MSRRTIVVFYQGDKKVHRWSLRANLHQISEKDRLNKLVERLIRSFMSRDKKYVQEELDFLAYNVYSQLKEVKTKLGELIWRR